MIYTSRSRVETFGECPRRGYINFLWDGRGLVKRAASVYLSTGSYTHIGLEYLCKAIKDLPSIWEMWKQNIAMVPVNLIDEAVNKALTAYQAEIQARGFDLEDGEDKANTQYVISEQCALVEAFIRAFAARVLPDLLTRFRIVDVEKEEIVIEGELCIQARIDVILEEIVTGDLYVVSFKTAANWDKRQEKANEHDNQGLSETWVLEHRLKEENEGLVEYSKLVDRFGVENISNTKLVQATKKYLEYLERFKKNEKVMGVIMIYMMKGKRYESYSTPGRWEQHSPLIRAYRKLVGTDYEYAATLYYDNPNNKSGKGKLGKGWESFLVWECEEIGGVKGWIQMLMDGKVQGDVIGEAFKIPAPYFRNQEHMDSWVRQIKAKEQRIYDDNKFIEAHPKANKVEMLDYYFDQVRKHCHYPVDCNYLDICYNIEIFNDPIGSGRFQYRIPHHEKEEKEHERLYQISSSNISTISSDSNVVGDNNRITKTTTVEEVVDEVVIDDMEVIIDE